MVFMEQKHIQIVLCLETKIKLVQDIDKDNRFKK